VLFGAVAFRLAPPFDLTFCAKAEPAADLDAGLVRPSRRTFEAAVAAFLLVVSLGDLDCVSALPAAVFEVLLVDFERSVFDAAFAALGFVCFDFAIFIPPTMNTFIRVRPTRTR
jgi:hypothetical protein